MKTQPERESPHLLAEQNRRRKALGEFLDEWAEEAGPPDPEDVAAMRRRHFTQ